MSFAGSAIPTTRLYSRPWLIFRIDAGKSPFSVRSRNSSDLYESATRAIVRASWASLASSSPLWISLTVGDRASFSFSCSLTGSSGSFAVAPCHRIRIGDSASSVPASPASMAALCRRKRREVPVPESCLGTDTFASAGACVGLALYFISSVSLSSELGVLLVS